MFETIKMIWQNYNLTGIPFVLIGISIAWILLFGKSKTEWRLLEVTLIFIIGIFGIQIADGCFHEESYNFELLVSGSVSVLICYAGVSMISRAITNWNNKTIVLACLLFLLVFQSGLNLKYDFSAVIEKIKNPYKVSEATIQIADSIKADGKIDLLYLIAPDEITSQIQEYDSDFRVVPGLSIYYQGNDVYGLLVAMDNTGCSCLVLPEDISDDGYMNENGYRKVSICDGYVIYTRS